jgi:hypothetical protein
MKELVARIDATPEKRLYHSIIADYDLNRAISELIDNAIDVAIRSKKLSELKVSVDIDPDRQTIVVRDNAGGLRREELALLISPGRSGSDLYDETIGLFGVGAKRAVVALASSISITTRHQSGKTFRIEYDDEWLGDSDWHLNYYEVDSIPEGETLIDLARPRIITDESAVENLRGHLSTTYAKFISISKVSILLDGIAIVPQMFEDWSYPPGWEPRKYLGSLSNKDGRIVVVSVLAGLSRESSPTTGDYGVFLYCNGRLVSRGLKSPEVGFTQGLAGPPHPKISLTRVIVDLQGAAADMPWNSSKSDINYNHATFRSLRNWLLKIVSDYAEVSRKWMGEWPEKVFKHSSGDIVVVENVDFPTAKKSYLPPAPKASQSTFERTAALNEVVAKSRPWVKGAYESVVAVDIIRKKRFSQGNRISLIVLDSTLEIAFKDYLVNDSGTYYSDAQIKDIFSSKQKTHTEVKKTVSLSQEQWVLIKYFADLRNKLVHERATVSIPDEDVRQLEGLVKDVLGVLFSLKFP